MTGQPVGRLWSRYLELRKDISAGAHDGEGRREVERQVAQLRDRLVVNYSPMVKYVASRVRARLTSVVNLVDMISWVVTGLNAEETYDPKRRTRATFASFAISKIRWAILDELRGQDWVPRRVPTRAQEVERATQKLSQDLLRPPTEDEIAEEVGTGVEEYRGFLDRYSRAQVASLEARLDTESGTIGEYGSLLVNAAAPAPRSQANLEELRLYAGSGAGTPRRDLLLLRGAYREGDRQSPEPHGGPHKPTPQTRPWQAARAPQELTPRLRRWRLAG